MSLNFDWEDTALRLLEMNLNGETLNAAGLKELFAPAPHILEELDITNDGENVEDLDRALYGGRPSVIEIRELKPTQIHHCKASAKHVTAASNAPITSDDTWLLHYTNVDRNDSN